MSVNIYVGNLTYNMTEDSLRKLFEQHGEVLSAKIITDRSTGRSKGFGFVEMSDNGAADNAIQQLNETEVEGRNIRVNVARPKRQ